MPLISFLILLSLVTGPVSAAVAQDGPEPLAWSPTFAGSEEERYLRVVQTAGAAGAHPWSIRSFSDAGLRQAAPTADGHPWASRFAAPPPAGEGLSFSVLPARGGAFLNSGFPAGENDGAVWAGRGITLAGTGGVAARYGPLSVVLAPVAFWAQNADFDTAPIGRSGPLAFGDAYWASGLDRPQRFGDDPYARLDWGQSSIRVEGRGVEARLSTANQVWGPAEQYPLILGGNAPGFPHVAVGTSHPRTTPLGSFHARLMWGGLEQSAYSFETEATRRFTTGWAVAYSPPGLPTLEIGAARFFHLPWPPSGGWDDALLHPFESFLKRDVIVRDDTNQVVEGPENQLASVFARWVFPGSGLEVYGEFAREDHSYRLRDFLVEPDHTSAYLLGLSHVWRRESSAWWALRAEVLNSARPQSTRIRFAGPFYVHNVLRQGHTHRGQTLGSSAAVGGGAVGLAVDRYDPSGRWSARFSREVQGERATATLWEGAVYPEPLDVLYAIGLERLLFAGPYTIAVQLGGGYNLDRYLRSDRVNFQAGVSLGFDPRVARVAR